MDKNFDVKDYFVTTADSTYELENSRFIKLDIKIAPSATGIKTTYVTAKSLDVWAIFSLTGGMFTTVNSIFALLAVHLIWGFNFKCLKFSGMCFTIFKFVLLE